ncbi:unnamed protein product, partial [Prorocentrum cordatum]
MGWHAQKYRGNSPDGGGKGQSKGKDNHTDTSQRHQHPSRGAQRDAHLHDAPGSAREVTAMSTQREAERAARTERKSHAAEIRENAASAAGELLGLTTPKNE